MSYVFPPPLPPCVPIHGTLPLFPVRRIFCVGRNYAAHAREMGVDPEREKPFFFTKPADAIVTPGMPVPYPMATQNFHHEVELVVAIGSAGRNVQREDALALVWGYGVGNDLTRRDLQFEARDKGRPWDAGKAFDYSAAVSALHPVSEVGHLSQGRIWLSVNGKKRQESNISHLIWPVDEVLVELSKLFELRPGDLVYTGTPEGVGPLVSGDLVECGIEGLDTLRHKVTGLV